MCVLVCEKKGVHMKMLFFVVMNNEDKCFFFFFFLIYRAFCKLYSNTTLLIIDPAISAYRSCNYGM